MTAKQNEAIKEIAEIEKNIHNNIISEKEGSKEISAVIDRYSFSFPELMEMDKYLVSILTKKN